MVYGTSGGLVASLCLAIILALTGDVAADDTISRPAPEDGGPTRVYVAVGLLDIDEIDSANQNFTANVFLAARWQDLRLAHAGPGDLVTPLTEIWHPRLQIVNSQRVLLTMPEVAYIAPDGRVEYRQRAWGPFSQRLAIREFPFDTQHFEIRVASSDAGPEEIEFTADPEVSLVLAPGFSLPDWEITEAKLDFSPYEPTGSRKGAASFALILNAKRYGSYYVLMIVVPLVLIVAMSFLVFWIDPKQSGTQIGVSTTSMLTLIAFRFAVSSDIPKVPYLTRMDVFILGSTLIVFASLMQAVVTSIMASRDRAELASRIDVWCRVIFPLAFIAVAIKSLLL